MSRRGEDYCYDPPDAPFDAPERTRRVLDRCMDGLCGGWDCARCYGTAEVERRLLEEDGDGE